MITKTERKKREYEMMLVHDYRQSLYKKPVLRQLFLEVTSRCNARCEHCGSRCDGNEQGEELSREEFEKNLYKIARHYNPRNIFINVTGGEPLMRKDTFDILKYATSLGFCWGMTTNGMLITKSVVEKMVESRIYSVSISIDGLKKTHEEFRKVPNSFDKIFKGIKLMQDCKKIPVIQVTTVVTKKNIHELEELYNILLDKGIEYWRVINCDPIGRALDSDDDILLDVEQYKYIFDFIKEKQSEGKMKQIAYGCSHYLGTSLEKEVRPNYFMCLAGLNIASILSNGDIFVCPNVPRRPEFIQGNVKTDDFIDVWENGFKPFRHENRTKGHICEWCEHWDYCNGDSFHTFDFDAQNPLICLKEMFDDGDGQVNVSSNESDKKLKKSSKSTSKSKDKDSTKKVANKKDTTKKSSSGKKKK